MRGFRLFCLSCDGGGDLFRGCRNNLRLMSRADAKIDETLPLSERVEGHVRSGLRGRMWIAIAAHLVIDLISFVVVPLMTVIKGHAQMTDAQGALLLGVGALSSGLVQPIVAVLSDRHDTRVIATIGMVVAGVCVGLVGFADRFELLLPLQILATAGIGAFHPVAAAAVGQAASIVSTRTRGVALFFAAGMVGGVLGNVFSPQFVRVMGGGDSRAGLAALMYIIPPALIMAGFLAWAIHGVPHRGRSAAMDHAALSSRERSERWGSVGLLYLGNVLRFTVDMMLIHLIIPWTEFKARLGAGVDPASPLTAIMRADASQMSGPMQAAKQVGMGVGGLVLGMYLSRRHERAMLVAVPIVGAVFLLLMPHTGEWTKLGDVGGLAALGLCVLAGTGCAGVMPMTISLAQRLLPHRTSLASGLMMGGAWAIAAIGPSLAQMLLRNFGFGWTFAVAAVLLVISGLLAIPLRMPEGEARAARPGKVDGQVG